MNSEQYQNSINYIEGSILYPTRNILSCQFDNEVNSYVFDYHVRERKIRLNDFLQDDRWIFVPVDGKHFINFGVGNNYDKNRLPEVQIPFSLRLCYDELYDILASFHEIGHAKLYSEHHDIINNCLNNGGINNLEKQLLVSRLYHLERSYRDVSLPDFSGSFRKQIKETFNFFSNFFSFGEYSKFHERFGWASSIWNVMQNDLLLEFDFEDFRHCYLPRLRSYGSDFTNWQGSERYGKWLSTDYEPWQVRKEKRSWKDSEEGKEKSEDFEKLLLEI